MPGDDQVRINVFDDKGNRGTIPVEQADEAFGNRHFMYALQDEQGNWKPAHPVAVTTPDGSGGWLPNGLPLKEAIQHRGFKLGPPNQQGLSSAEPYKGAYDPGGGIQAEYKTTEQAQPGAVANFTYNLLKPFSVYQTAHPLEEEKQFWKDLTEHPVQTVAQHNVLTAIGQGAQEEGERALKEFKAGQWPKGVIHTVQSAIPIIGPQMGKGEEQAESGDISGALGTAGSIGLQVGSGSPETVSAVTKPVVSGAQVVRGAFAPKPPLARALPGLSRESATTSTSLIQQAAQDLNIKLDSADNVLQAAKQARQSLVDNSGDLSTLSEKDAAVLTDKLQSIKDVEDAVVKQQRIATENAKKPQLTRGESAQKVVKGVVKGTAGGAIASMIPGSSPWLEAAGIGTGIPDVVKGLSGLIQKTPVTPELLDSRLATALQATNPAEPVPASLIKDLVTKPAPKGPEILPPEKQLPAGPTELPSSKEPISEGPEGVLPAQKIVVRDPKTGRMKTFYGPGTGPTIYQTEKPVAEPQEATEAPQQVPVQSKPVSPETTPDLESLIKQEVSPQLEVFRTNTAETIPPSPPRPGSLIGKRLSDKLTPEEAQYFDKKLQRDTAIEKLPIEEAAKLSATDQKDWVIFQVSNLPREKFEDVSFRDKYRNELKIQLTQQASLQSKPVSLETTPGPEVSATSHPTIIDEIKKPQLESRMDLTFGGARTGEAAAFDQLTHTSLENLSAIAKVRGLRETGTTEQLIQRIHDDLTPEEVKAFGDAAIEAQRNPIPTGKKPFERQMKKVAPQPPEDLSDQLQASIDKIREEREAGIRDQSFNSALRQVAPGRRWTDLNAAEQGKVLDKAMELRKQQPLTKGPTAPDNSGMTTVDKQDNPTKNLAGKPLPQDTYFYHGTNSNATQNGLKPNIAQLLKDDIEEGNVKGKPEDYKGVYLASTPEDAALFGPRVFRIKVPKGTTLIEDPSAGGPGDSVFYIHKAPIKASQVEEVPYPETETVGTKEGAAADTLDFNRALKSLFPGKKAGDLKPTELSQVMQLAQKYKTEGGFARGDVPQALGEGARKLASVFYSKMIDVAQNKLAPFFQADTVIPMLKNAGVRDDEIKYSGLQDYLTGKGKVSKQDLMDYLNKNQLKVDEVWKNHNNYQDVQNFIDNHPVADEIKKSGLEPVWDENDGLIFKAPSGEMLAPEDLSKAGQKKAQRLEEDVQDLIKSSRNPKIQRLLAETRDIDSQFENGELTDDEYDDLLEENHRALMEAGYTGEGDESSTKYHDYQMPGGSNYKELLLTIPEKPTQPLMALNKWAIENFDGAARKDVLESINKLNTNPSEAIEELEDEHSVPPNLIEPFENQKDSRSYPNNFTSSHWDEPNVLAHVRMNDRVSPDGKKTLFIEEIQSDWHQQGREKGYSREYSPGDRITVPRNGKDVEVTVTSQEGPTAKVGNLRVKDDNGNIFFVPRHDLETVPDAPFKKDWHELALKRVLRYAAENGYDRVAWTTGEQQAARYDLSRQVDSIRVSSNDGKTFEVKAFKGDNTTPIISKSVKPEELSDLIGKDLSNKVIQEHGQSLEDQNHGWTISRQLRTSKDPTSDNGWLLINPSRNIGIEQPFLTKATAAKFMEDNNLHGPESWSQVYTGKDLQVGGQGMKGFYDKMIPDFLNRYGKKWGTKVGETQITRPNETRVEETSNPGPGAFVVIDRGGSTWYYGTREAAEAKAKDIDSKDTTTQPSIDITPPMRHDLLKKGQPISELQSSKETVA